MKKWSVFTAQAMENALMASAYATQVLLERTAQYKTVSKDVILQELALISTPALNVTVPASVEEKSAK
jgi:hypothetical protein